MAFSDALKRLDSMALGARYGGEVANFRIRNSIGREIIFQSSIQREDSSSVFRNGKHVEEIENRAFIWVSRIYLDENDVETSLVPCRDLFVQLDGNWFTFESILESDGSGFLLQFKRPEFAGATLNQNRRS